MKRFAMTLAALGLAGAAISPAFANTGEPMTAKVQYDDLNLASPEGQITLDKRIERAARTVCRVTDVKTGTRILNQESRACLAKARADARQQVALRNGQQQRGG